MPWPCDRNADQDIIAPTPAQGRVELCHLTEDGCLGSICEVCDGDPVQCPGGCRAQAGSVAEPFRIYRLVATD